MQAHPAHTTDPAQEAADRDAQRHVANGLVTMGNDIACLLHAHALAQAASQPAPHAGAARPVSAPDALIRIAAAFDKTARTVRRCILLAQRLARPEKPAPDPAAHRTQARKRILREVEDTIGRDAHEGTRAETLQAELHERLDAPDLDDDLATRPVEDIITEIRRDLGLAAMPGTNPWKRRTPQDLADLHARAAAPAHPRHAAGPASRSAPQPVQPATAPPDRIPIHSPPWRPPLPA